MSTDLELPPIDRGWWSWSGAHGGLVAALMLRHARNHAAGFAARSLHASFLQSIEEAPLTATTEVVRKSKSSAVTRSMILQGGAPALLGTALFSSSQDKPTTQTDPMPDVAPAADCPDAGFPVEFIPFAQHLEVRIAGGGTVMGGGPDAVMLAWIRLRELTLDPAEAVLVLLDSMPPALYAAMTSPVPIPTAEYSVHFTDGLAFADLTDWALIRVATDQASDTWTVDSSSLWSPDGTLLAAGRQTRRILRGN